MLKYTYITFMAFVGAIIYRIRGGLVPAMPRPIDQILFSLPYGAIAYKASGRKSWVFFLVLALTVVATATGHGQYMDLGAVTREVSPETLDFIVQLFFGEDTYNNYWRDAFGLAVTGLAVTLPASTALVAFNNYWQGAVLFLTGFSKPIAYMIGWHFFDHTEAGEYITGGLSWLSVALLWGFIKND